MNHAITIGDVLFWGGFGLAVAFVGALVFGLLAAYGREMSR